MVNQALPEVVVLARSGGGWLAVSAPGEPIRLAVVGPDEQAAREAFRTSAGRWIELCEPATRTDEGTVP